MNKSLDRDVVIKTRGSRSSRRTNQTNDSGPKSVFMTNSSMRNTLQQNANNIAKTKGAT